MAEAYPRTLMELERQLSSEAACAEYLARLRWPEGFRCPGCGSSRAWRTARGLWVCRDCERQTSVTAGTVFGDSNLPLALWFRAIWYIVTQKDGASALGLQRVIQQAAAVPSQPYRVLCSPVVAATPLHGGGA